MAVPWRLELGANRIEKGKTLFKVWAPHCKSVEVKILQIEKPSTLFNKFVKGINPPLGDRYELHTAYLSPKVEDVSSTDSSVDPPLAEIPAFAGMTKWKNLLPLRKDDAGYFSGEFDGVSPGDSYHYILDHEKERPDPVSRFLPQGVHGPSSIVDPAQFDWKDQAWKGIPFKNFIFYELHIGTFTPEGTFEGAIKKIPYLKDLGITCIEVTPVAQFPGTRNWGYDGASLYAVQNSYSGPAGFKKFVDAAHRAGLAVCLDVVYNHLGPEGNFLNDYGPSFTSQYRTPWGDAVNYDGPYSDHVRRFITDNALYWVTEYHVDALRLDAVHRIYDFSARPILEEIHTRVQEQARFLDRQIFVIAESDLNDSKIIRPNRQGGYGLEGQWSDDFHHSVHAYLTGEKKGYYKDFGQLAHIAKALQKGFVYDGKYSSFRKRKHGNTLGNLSLKKLVVCVQNHDQVGNRAWGERLSSLAPLKVQKLAAVLLLLSPNTPLLFMGQEYGETAPFQYFIDHSDPDLVRTVQEGRRKEFAAFGWENIPDPKAEQTFLNSKLQWNLLKKEPHQCLLNLYKELIQLRKSFQDLNPPKARFDEGRKLLSVEYSAPGKKSFGIVFSFSERDQTFVLPFHGKLFNEILNTEYTHYGGKLKPSKRKYKNEILMPPYSAIAGRLN